MPSKKGKQQDDGSEILKKVFKKKGKAVGDDLNYVLPSKSKHGKKFAIVLYYRSFVQN